ncbi:hypothetical protein Gocc_0869 [Gaiella occulta]|uniref:DUF3866 family protein n=1 Tax=Gaiella occulta TaxID=1002870 RepID=A0A7M2YZX2_9ACTN|nr:DUF3866 family protein [Gaiella occulta]RDI75071.1 hypothetical protein Gocc_0869 [Gaiella occulta]
MALSLRFGTVTAVSQRLVELIRCEVDGVPCIAYPRQTGPVEVGDIVLVNTQARDLELGSGGFDLLYANLTRGLGLPAADGAHVMALPYGVAQSAARCVEESGALAGSLGGMPVVCCGLHSQVAPAAAAIGRGRRVAFVQIAGGALPVALSDTVRALKSRRLLDTAVAVAPCHDGDVQAVTLPGALAWARQDGFDAVVCGVGPGIVGTGSEYGHGGLALAAAVNATVALGGRAIVTVRFSDGDPRDRHRGVSHHTRSALRFCVGDYEIAWPAMLGEPSLGRPVTEVDVDGWAEACAGLPLAHMGRGPAEDPGFFAAAFAAGRLASRYLD